LFSPATPGLSEVEWLWAGRSLSFFIAVFAKTSIITLAPHEIAGLRHLVRVTKAAGADNQSKLTRE